MAITLRPYQAQGVADLRAAYDAGSRSTLYVLPTGGGKTVTFCYIGEQASHRGSRVCVLVHREELLAQTSAALSGMGVPHGCIAPGHTFQPRQLVQVASVQTLVRRLDLLDSAGWNAAVLITDEAHHAVAGSWRKVQEHWAGSLRHHIGVTATPVRMGGQGLGDVFDHMVEGPQIGDLIQMGYLAKPITYAPARVMDLDGVVTVRGDFERKALESRADKPRVTGDAIAHYTTICRGAPAIAFCVSVAHAEHVAEQFREAGYSAASLDGSMDSDTRRRRIRDLAEGRLHVLTSCDIVSEGTDIPVVTAAIMLRPTKSEGLYIQQGGRVLRPAPGKQFAIILDHAGNCGMHGLIDSPRQWSLEDKRVRRANSAEDEEFVPPPLTCPGCFAVVKIPIPDACPVCGHKLRKVKDRLEALVEEHGHLQQVAAERRQAEEQATAQRQAEKYMKLREQDACSTIDELRQLAIRRGYKNPQAWAMAIATARKAKGKRMPAR